MLGTGAHLAAGTIERTCAELEVVPPFGYIDGMDDADKLKANLARVSASGTSAGLLDAVFDAIAAGDHPADDENVRRLALMVQLENYELHRQVDDRAKKMVGDAVCRFADDLVALWHAATAKDGPVLVATAADPAFDGVTNLADMRPAQLIDTDAHKRWVAAATALRRLEAAATGFVSLLRATGLSYQNGYATLALAPNISLENLAEVNHDSDRANRASAWTLAQHNITPVLCANLGDFVAACGAVSAQQYAYEQSIREANTMTRFT
jgi:hypothetical protein